MFVFHNHFTLSSGKNNVIKVVESLNQAMPTTYLFFDTGWKFRYIFIYALSLNYVDKLGDISYTYSILTQLQLNVFEWSARLCRYLLKS